VEASVVVASHQRAGRLRTLLDALAAQTFPRESWELVVVHTYDPDTAAALLDGHELARAGLLRHERVDPADAGPALQRNRGWRSARGRLIAFTDDDCRPEPDWLERLVHKARESPGQIVQGATRPDALDADAFRSPHVRTLLVDPPGRFTQTCNILYERELLERVGGFDEVAVTGEDIDLARRAQATGAAVVGAPDALVHHAIEALTLTEKIRSQDKWQHLAYVVKRHPELRRDCAMGIWWKPEHWSAVLALAALAAAPRRPWLLAGTLPYLQIERRRHGTAKREQLRALRELPGHFVIELAEVGTFIRGSLRYRTLLL
jgi:glycosyltransferase involved in cell wall biosynthesis